MSSGLNRDCIDKYYTSLTAVSKCIQLFKEHVHVYPDDIIVEPSAGSGAFLGVLSDMHPNVIAFDIQPEGEGILKRDFLTVDLSPDSRYHFVGNPPFGRQSSLAKKFIKRSCQYGQSVSFVLPKSFKKESFQKTFPLNFHLIVNEDLPPYSFELDGRPWDVPCVFQIWERRGCDREVAERVEPTYWRYVKKDEDPDLAFRRVGVYAGRMDREIESKSIQSHYFLKLDIDVDEFMAKYESQDWFTGENTVGPRSISKTELNTVLESLQN